jgi:hypothetical protein
MQSSLHAVCLHLVRLTARGPDVWILMTDPYHGLNIIMSESPTAQHNVAQTAQQWLAVAARAAAKCCRGVESPASTHTCSCCPRVYVCDLSLAGAGIKRSSRRRATRATTIIASQRAAPAACAARGQPRKHNVPSTRTPSYPARRRAHTAAQPARQPEAASEATSNKKTRSDQQSVAAMRINTCTRDQSRRARHT